MIEFVRTDDFIVAATAVVSIGIGIFVKSASRRDHQKFFLREDFAVGLDLLVTSIIILVTRASDLRYSISPWWFVCVFLALGVTSTWVRRRGWSDDDRLKLGTGILIPGLFGLLSFLAIIFLT